MTTFSRHFDFTPPDIEDLASLNIYESPVATGPWTLIEQVTAVGTYPDYISEYTTQLATLPDGWYAIEWMDSKGATTGLSNAIIFGTETLVGRVLARVMERDATLDRRVVNQEAEAAIQYYFGSQTDPYDPTLTVDYVQLNGLVYLTMFRVKVVELALESGESTNVSIGLVSMRAATQTAKSASYMQGLLDLANSALGLETSLVLQIEDIHFGRYQRIEMMLP